VAKDATRPFIVAANGIEVRAVGTAFVVQVGGTAVEVVVTEGTVAVDKLREASAVATAATLTPPAPLATVGAGNRVTIDLAAIAVAPAPPAVIAVTEAELSSRLAWRVPRLEFSGTPLAEVIPMFNRHGRTKLMLDPALGGLQMSGVLRADNVDALLQLLKNEFGIEAERAGAAEIHLRRK
jgi:transmembrane sensor